jgi:hypothetical protein
VLERALANVEGVVEVTQDLERVVAGREPQVRDSGERQGRYLLRVREDERDRDERAERDQRVERPPR